MVIKSLRFFLLGIFLIVGVLVFSGIVSATSFEDCWAKSGTTQGECVAVSGCNWETNETDPWCDMSPGCCMETGCWNYDGNESACTNSSLIGMNCTWDPYFQMYYPNGTQGEMGGCMGDWDNMDWGGMTDGCWNYDGDKAACGINSCNWKPNGANENSWCWIKSLSDAQMENPSATLTDVGCCEQTGCWSYDGNESTCLSVFGGMCFYENSSYGEGWCMAKMCSDAGTNETECNTLMNDLYMPCTYNSSGNSECLDSYWGGGFGAYNDTDSCFDQGGWYNMTGDCVMPTDGGGMFGGGGFMFGGGAHCWFADNQPGVCGNITGCAYCVVGTGHNGISNSSAQNICYNAQIGWCEGHVAGDLTYTNANNTANLVCTDIKLKSACKYGPLPNCKWDNTTVSVGAYCNAGTTSDKKALPPVGFCEHPDSKNNYTLCTQLIEEFMMPCTWDNSSAVVKNCTFNSGAVFGSGAETDLGMVGSEISCTASGGTWQTEYYIEGNILKQDSWCEQTGFFNVDDGVQEANKVNCDTSCWACEFQSNGSAWATAADGESACVSSALGYCTWTNDSAGISSFNGLGWCDYPLEMEYSGSGDCNTDCEHCDFMNSPYTACIGSVAGNGTGCQWVNDSSAGGVGAGYCVDKTKKVCSNDCFSCYDVTTCQNSSISCAWDTTSNLCSPQGFSGEICFDGVDNDADTLIDCSDPDCGFDNFCGGSAFGGDCFAQATEGECNQTVAFGDLNCSWINDTWNPSGWCDMPGANCWKYDDNLTACGAVAGCTNDTSSMGAGGFCDINNTKMDGADCWANSDETDCIAASGDCQWKNDTWCSEGTNNVTDSWCVDNPNAGWCDFKPFAICMDLNETGCGLNLNCTWQTDSYSMQGGWCDVACFDWDLAEGDCVNGTAGTGGLCAWKNMTDTCQPSTFMMMGVGVDGKTGCWQYDGNETGCIVNNFTCTYVNDSYSNNNLTADEPSGWCMDKAEYQHFGDVKGDVVELFMDSGNVMGLAEDGVSGEVDIMGGGMRVSDEGFNFGAGVFNISNSILCNGYSIGAKMQMNGSASSGTMGVGNASSKFYWYLDTDGIETGACNASGVVNYSGYDFMISYVARNTSNGVVETKQLMRCSSGTWTATNALVTTSKKLSCGEIGGVMIAVALQDLESFSEYDKTANMRIFMASANATDSRVSPSDYVGPGYYTPGSIDFGFVDCSDPNTKDPKCKNMQKFGFNVFEECMNGIDDNEDGLADCADPTCLFTPKCAGSSAFSFGVNTSDKVAPTVMFSEVDELGDGAFMKIDTNEPSNMSVQFYFNDSTCKILNATIDDIGTEAYQQNANFKPFHALDLINESYSLGYALSNGTSYYYKIKTCDPSGNCAVSKCSNFTTKTSPTAKSFIFKLDLPEGYTVDIPALNKTGYNFTETFTINGVPTAFDVGIKTNTSVTKNINITVHSNCENGLSIGFYGVNIYEPVKIDMSSAFVCDAATDMMGMNSSLKKWNKLIDEMHLGGGGDYIQMNMPVAYSASNTFNFVDDNGANPQDVDDYVNCASGGVTSTACKIPVSLGF